LVDEPGESLHTSFEELQRGDPGERIRQQMEEFEEFRKGK
jgi:hypothetical protein